MTTTPEKQKIPLKKHLMWVAYLLATRPKTLTAAIVPVLTGTLLTNLPLKNIDWVIFLFMLLSSLCIQIGTNFINDAIDCKRGVDTEERIGPQRMTASGELSIKQVYAARILFFILAALFGIPLIQKQGFAIACVLILSILSGYLYTGGTKPRFISVDWHRRMIKRDKTLKEYVKNTASVRETWSIVADGWRKINAIIQNKYGSANVEYQELLYPKQK